MWRPQAEAEGLTLLKADNKTGYFGVNHHLVAHGRDQHPHAREVRHNKLHQRIAKERALDGDGEVGRTGKDAGGVHDRVDEALEASEDAGGGCHILALGLARRSEVGTGRDSGNPRDSAYRQP